VLLLLVLLLLGLLSLAQVQGCGSGRQTARQGGVAAPTPLQHCCYSCQCLMLVSPRPVVLSCLGGHCQQNLLPWIAAAAGLAVVALRSAPHAVESTATVSFLHTATVAHTNIDHMQIRCGHATFQLLLPSQLQPPANKHHTTPSSTSKQWPTQWRQSSHY
jgi:hypothetical protein